MVILGIADFENDDFGFLTALRSVRNDSEVGPFLGGVGVIQWLPSEGMVCVNLAANPKPPLRRQGSTLVRVTNNFAQ